MKKGVYGLWCVSDFQSVQRERMLLICLNWCLSTCWVSQKLIRSAIKSFISFERAATTPYFIPPRTDLSPAIDYPWLLPNVRFLLFMIYFESLWFKTFRKGEHIKLALKSLHLLALYFGWIVWMTLFTVTFIILMAFFLVWLQTFDAVRPYFTSQSSSPSSFSALLRTLKLACVHESPSARFHFERNLTAEHQYLMRDAAMMDENSRTCYCLKIPCCEMTLPNLHICLRSCIRSASIGILASPPHLFMLLIFSLWLDCIQMTHNSNRNESTTTSIPVT